MRRVFAFIGGIGVLEVSLFPPDATDVLGILVVFATGVMLWLAVGWPSGSE